MPDAGLFYHDVLRALADAHARYVIVGGVAVNLQGVPRFTADLDVAVALDAENLRAIADAMNRLGLVPRLPGSIEQLSDPDTVREWIQDGNLEELERDAEVVSAGGIVARVASIDALISMKTGTGRAQDASDVEALRRIKELEDEG